MRPFHSPRFPSYPLTRSSSKFDPTSPPRSPRFCRTPSMRPATRARDRRRDPARYQDHVREERRRWVRQGRQRQEQGPALVPLSAVAAHLARRRTHPRTRKWFEGIWLGSIEFGIVFAGIRGDWRLGRDRTWCRIRYTVMSCTSSSIELLDPGVIHLTLCVMHTSWRSKEDAASHR